MNRVPKDIHGIPLKYGDVVMRIVPDSQTQEIEFLRFCFQKPGKPICVFVNRYGEPRYFSMGSNRIVGKVAIVIDADHAAQVTTCSYCGAPIPVAPDFDRASP